MDATRREPTGPPPPRPGTGLTLDVTDLTSAGEGVARHDGWVVFVPGAVPGDRVAARVERLGRGFVRARLTAVEQSAPERVTAPCPHQAACGGCPLMVLEPAAALAVKVRHLAETLRRIGRLDAPPVEVDASPVPTRYRGRVTFAVAPRTLGAIAGFHPPGDAGRLVPIDDCLLGDPDAARTARALLTALDAALPRGAAWPERLEVRASLARGVLLLVAQVAPGAWPGARRAAERVRSAEPRVAGVVRAVLRGGRVTQLETLAGEGALVETIGGLDVELGASGFLQVNPAAAGRLYARVAAALAPAGAGGRLLDIYCGAGLGGLLGTPPGWAIEGIEWDRASVARAVRAAQAAGRSTAHYVAADAVAAAEDLAARGERFDAVLLNPPRAGAGPRVAAAVRALGARRAAFVSCDPATLARDLAAFAAAGYRLASLAAVDMFPHTAHLEAVAALEAAW